MVSRLALVGALIVLAVASFSAEPLDVSLAQQITTTLTPTGTLTPTPSAATTGTATPQPTTATTAATSTPAAITAGAATTTATPPSTATTATQPSTTGTPPSTVTTATPQPTATATATRTPTSTPTRTATPMPSSTPTSTRTPTPTATRTPTPTSTPTPVAPIASGISLSSITRSSATVTWITNVPATSQVELGINAVDTLRSRLDDSLVTEHRVVLTGLLPGATYRFRVRSVGADGGVGVSPEGPLVTAPAGSGPEISSVSVRQLTSTTARLAWATSTGVVAQAEYGATANYGGFTLLKVFTSPAQEMVLSSLRPGTNYHFRIKAWDGDGFLGASADATFTTAVAGLATLLGDSVVETERVTLSAGQAAAYQYVAAQSGQASLARLYVDSGSSAPVIRVALYSDEAGTPGAIIAQGSAPGLIAGWISVSLPPVALLKDTRYWLVVLSPIGAGSLNLRDFGLGGSSMLSAQTTLAALPRTWTAGNVAVRSPLSAYVQQVPPAITLMGPAEGSVVTGSVLLSAVVDDDAPIARVQFLVDGNPIGAPVTAAPYSAVWDTRDFSPTQPHTITARATDLLGRSNTSGVASVQVDNGPVLTKVMVSPGLTSTSARVTWTTDVLADGQVEYGPTAAYGMSTPIDPRVDWRHAMQITALAPGSTYHYRVRSRDAAGALAVSADQTFFTAEP